VDGGEGEREIGGGRDSGGEIPESYAPDGALVFSTEGAKSGADLWIRSPGEPPEGRPLLAGPFDECYARVSPDGRFLAFVSNESGRMEVYLTTFPEPGARLQLSVEGGEEPAWTRSGKEVLFLGREGVMAVPVETSPSLSAGTPRKLFDWSPPAPMLEGAYRNQWDATPDGERLLLLETSDDPGSRRLNVVLNWTEEISRGSR
jgi:serine/threonine-protein kinase